MNPLRSDRFDTPEFRTLLQDLRDAAPALEESGASPVGQLDRMAAAGVMRWGIPAPYGGVELPAAEQAAGMERLASACLVSTFVLSQRQAAVSRIVASRNERLKADLLPRLADHAATATVGISHLTTSRQHLGKPVVSATPNDEGFVLEGTVPWVTGGGGADLLLAGGTLSDGRQVLAVMPTADDGVTVEPPVPLLALNASQTGAVTLRRVAVGSEQIVAGPVEGVMKQAGGGAGGVTTSALAVGAARGVLDRFTEEAARRPELNEILRPLQIERESLSADISSLLDAPPDALPAGLTGDSVRRRANSLALRASQAYLAASKGAGFVKGHPAERAVREAMFFLVWSCPKPVVEAALRRFACLGD